MPSPVSLTTRSTLLPWRLSCTSTNPFRDVNFIYTPGKDPGTADLELQVKDRFPIRVFAGYEDTGNDLTGDERFFTGLNATDIFGTDQQLNYQYTTDPTGKKLGTVSQKNEVPQGSLDGSWGKTADAAAAAAAQGIVKLLPQPTQRTSSN